VQRDLVQAPCRLLLTASEVAHALSCGRSYVYTLMAQGELPTVKLGRLTRVPADALTDFVQRKLREPGE